LLLVVDNGSIYTKNLVNFLSEKKIKFINKNDSPFKKLMSLNLK